MKKRLLSLALALALCLGLAVPVSASPAETGYLSDSYEVFRQVAAGDWSMSLVAPYDYGLKDKAGNVVIPATYSGMYLFRNLIIAAVGGDADSRAGAVGLDLVPPLYGIIDLDQNVILPYQYESISPIYQRDHAASTTDNVYSADGFTGLFGIKKNGLSGVMADANTRLLVGVVRYCWQPDFPHGISGNQLFGRRIIRCREE